MKPHQLTYTLLEGTWFRFLDDLSEISNRSRGEQKLDSTRAGCMIQLLDYKGWKAQDIERIVASPNLARDEQGFLLPKRLGSLHHKNNYTLFMDFLLT